MKSDMVLLTSCEDLAEYSRLKYDHQIPCSKMGKHDEKCRSSKENRNDGHSLMKVIYVKDIEKNEEVKDLKTIVGTRKIHSI